MAWNNLIVVEGDLDGNRNAGQIFGTFHVDVSAQIVLAQEWHTCKVVALDNITSFQDAFGGFTRWLRFFYSSLRFVVGIVSATVIRPIFPYVHIA